MKEEFNEGVLEEIDKAIFHSDTEKVSRLLMQYPTIIKYALPYPRHKPINYVNVLLLLTAGNVDNKFLDLIHQVLKLGVSPNLCNIKFQSVESLELLIQYGYETNNITYDSLSSAKGCMKNFVNYLRIVDKQKYCQENNIDDEWSPLDLCMMHATNADKPNICHEKYRHMYEQLSKLCNSKKVKEEYVNNLYQAVESKYIEIFRKNYTQNLKTLLLCMKHIKNDYVLMNLKKIIKELVIPLERLKYTKILKNDSDALFAMQNDMSEFFDHKQIEQFAEIFNSSVQECIKSNDKKCIAF